MGGGGARTVIGRPAVKVGAPGAGSRAAPGAARGGGATAPARQRLPSSTRGHPGMCLAYAALCGCGPTSGTRPANTRRSYSEYPGGTPGTSGTPYLPPCSQAGSPLIYNPPYCDRPAHHCRRCATRKAYRQPLLPTSAAPATKAGITPHPHTYLRVCLCRRSQIASSCACCVCVCVSRCVCGRVQVCACVRA